VSQKDEKIVSLDDILVTSLNRIPTIGGDVLHALKLSDPGFFGFGEIYFSWINSGTVKAWKCHKLMTLNLVVPIGEVHFVFHLLDHKGDFRIEVIGDNRYVRLTVPPGIWFGFQGIASESSLLVNVADIEHNPDEVIRKSVSEFTYDWSKS
jgi:dTDP-4-dehydrorhamnose 3,5-epimerase